MNVRSLAPLESVRRDVTPRARSVLAAAVALFSRFGYHGTSMRDIANHVGVGPGALYNHWPGKQDILFYLMDSWLAELHNSLLPRLAQADEPAQRLRAFVEHHVAFHGAHAAEMLICDSELPALTARHHRVVLSKRRRYEEVLDAIVRDGVASGAFADVDVRLTTLQVLGMCTHVATWFNPAGRLGIDVVAAAYADRLLDGLRPRAS
jgi:AcrR family transcriptional regulator